jgi:hypothetical protein
MMGRSIQNALDSYSRGGSEHSFYDDGDDNDDDNDGYDDDDDGYDNDDDDDD